MLNSFNIFDSYFYEELLLLFPIHPVLYNNNLFIFIILFGFRESLCKLTYVFRDVVPRDNFILTPNAAFVLRGQEEKKQTSTDSSTSACFLN